MDPATPVGRGTGGIQPKSWPLKLQGPGPGDIAPHAVMLGEKLVPQSWTITMTNDNGDDQFAGSITDTDGEGHGTRLFVSHPKYPRLSV